MEVVPGTLLSAKRTLLIWHSGHVAEETQEAVVRLRKRAGDNGTVLLEHAQRLLLGRLVTQ